MSDTTHEAPLKIWLKADETRGKDTPPDQWADPLQGAAALEYVRADLVKERSDEVQAAVAAEREWCAKVAEAHDYTIQSSTTADLRAIQIAAAIRKGGE